MKTIINYIIDIIKWIWQFPQNILAICLEGILCETAVRRGKYKGAIIIDSIVLLSSVSLGNYIFINPLSSTQVRTIRHEYGHRIQSLILGPLYLVVIGIPSVLHNIVHYLCYKIGIKWDYNKFYTELWANKLTEKYKNIY